MTDCTSTWKSSSALSHGRSRSKAFTRSLVTAASGACASSRGAVVRTTPSTGRGGRAPDAEFGPAPRSVPFPPSHLPTSPRPPLRAQRLTTWPPPPRFLSNSGPPNATSPQVLPRLQALRVTSRPAAEASPYPPSTPLTACYGEEPAGHRGDDFVAHVEAPGVDLSHLTSGNQVFGNGDVLGLLPGPKWEHWLLPAPGRVCRPLPWVFLGTVASWGCSCSPTP